MEQFVSEEAVESTGEAERSGEAQEIGTEAIARNVCWFEVQQGKIMPFVQSEQLPGCMNTRAARHRLPRHGGSLFWTRESALPGKDV